MTLIKRLGASLVMLLIMINSATAQDSDPARQRKLGEIANLLKITHTQELSEQVFNSVINQMIGSLQRSKPQVPAAFWQQSRDAIAKEFHNSVGDMTQGIILIYDKHYTEEDIQGLTAFYTTPLGQKMITQTPQITQEAMALGRVWGQQVGARALQRLREMGKQQGINL